MRSWEGGDRPGAIWVVPGGVRAVPLEEDMVKMSTSTLCSTVTSLHVSLRHHTNSPPWSSVYGPSVPAAPPILPTTQR